MSHVGERGMNDKREVHIDGMVFLRGPSLLMIFTEAGLSTSMGQSPTKLTGYFRRYRNLDRLYK
jgi:hypothetical protein